jgi:hypothetical protein
VHAADCAADDVNRCGCVITYTATCRSLSGCAVFYEQLEANGTGNSSRAGSLAAQALVLQMQADSLSVANEFGSLLQVCT